MHRTSTKSLYLVLEKLAQNCVDEETLERREQVDRYREEEEEEEEDEEDCIIVVISVHLQARCGWFP